MNRMILANLVHRPFRTMISVVAVAVEVTLILLIVGLSVGMLDDSRNRQAGIGADIMVQPPELVAADGSQRSAGLRQSRRQDHEVAARRGGRSRRYSTLDGGSGGSYRRHRHGFVQCGERRLPLPVGRAVPRAG